MNRYPTALTAIYGLAEWGGKLYAFTGSGDAYEMTLGTPVIAVPIPIVSKPLNGFVGAGSSTRVPLVPR